jgi:hypothetical protein
LARLNASQKGEVDDDDGAAKPVKKAKSKAVKKK